MEFITSSQMSDSNPKRLDGKRKRNLCAVPLTSCRRTALLFSKIASSSFWKPFSCGSSKSGVWKTTMCLLGFNFLEWKREASFSPRPLCPECQIFLKAFMELVKARFGDFFYFGPAPDYVCSVFHRKDNRKWQSCNRMYIYAFWHVGFNFGSLSQERRGLW